MTVVFPCCSEAPLESNPKRSCRDARQGQAHATSELRCDNCLFRRKRKMELNVPRAHRENSSNPCVEEQLKRHWANFIRRSYSRVFLKFISRAILRPEDLEETATATSGVLSLTHGGASFVYFHSGVPSKNVLRRRAQHRTQLVPVVGMLLPGIGRAPILF